MARIEIPLRPGGGRELRARGVEVEAPSTNEAVSRYRELDFGRTAAAPHLTR
jgi:hypothetical protein